MRTILAFVIAAAAVATLGACGTIGDVQPWEKGNLAKPSMGFDFDPLDDRYMLHVYSSKENSTGGYGVGGGGCGCN